MCKSRSRVLRFILSAATVFGLVGCGGGGTRPSGPDAAEAGQPVAAAAPDAEAKLASALPQSYTITTIAGPWGLGGNPSVELPNASRGHVLDDEGRFGANLIPHGGGPPQAFLYGTGAMSFESSIQEGISPNGIIVGTGFTISGQTVGYILSTNTQEARYLEDAHARLISASGLVGGHTCPPDDGFPCTDAFHWNPATGDVAVHPGFQAVSMNNAGLMLGMHASSGSGGRLATVDPSGKISPVSFEPGAGFTVAPQFIADGGAIFLNTVSTIHFTGNAAPAAGDAIVLLADCVPEIVGRGIVPRPSVCESAQCLERTTFTGFSATGHAVGVDQWHYLDDTGSWQLAAEGGFHWNASEGTTAIRVGDAAGLPVAVNAQGVAIGALAGSREAFIWSRDAEGMLLRPAVAPNLGPEVVSIRVAAIGDAGHLLVFTSNADPLEFPATSLHLLTPRN